MLHFIQFHTRNSISEKSSQGVSKHILTVGGKIIEHTLNIIGVKATGLTNDILSDPDIDRCVREILIEQSINTMNIGPKTDLAIKVCGIIAKRDATNRGYEAQIQMAREAERARNQKAPPAKPKEDLAKEYKDL